MSISCKIYHLRATFQYLWVGREGFYHRLIILGLVKQHLCMTLRPIWPLRGDNIVDVAVSVQGYRSREEGVLESFLKVGVVESRRDTKSVKKQTGVTYSHTIRQNKKLTC